MTDGVELVLRLPYTPALRAAVLAGDAAGRAYRHLTGADLPAPVSTYPELGAGLRRPPGRAEAGRDER